MVQEGIAPCFVEYFIIQTVAFTFLGKGLEGETVSRTTGKGGANSSSENPWGIGANGEAAR
ncbi:MAG TPA: hypothetical protein GX735_03700 [Firmicutes bacterium]|jgi:hypothetical protein|nr:hypothetical protein [Bacillota bacterium]